jgi:hypothetical protein
MSGAEFLLDTNVVAGLLRGDEAAGELLQRLGASAARLAVSQTREWNCSAFQS